MSEPFRTATTATETAATGVEATRSSISASKQETKPGLYTYQALKGEPYTVEAFKLKNFFNHPDYKNMREQVNEVDSWIQQQAKSRGLEDKTDSYQEIVDEILKQIGKSDNEQPIRTFERVQKAISAQVRLSEAKLPTVLDVHSMSADEYKETRV